VPLDRNQKARIHAYAKAGAVCTQSVAQKGAVTRAFLEVLAALLGAFITAAPGSAFRAMSGSPSRLGALGRPWPRR
jgi:hypothetical protein